ncbi:GatB/YqeY domain-containing protein [candidate division KSB1 bacterium]|nr:GatB/YqeY domain-containing protein [candidate division KSB1 bacterium]
MSIQAKLMEDIKSAMKSGDKQRVATLRLVVSQMKNMMIDKRAELTQDEEISVLLNAAKKRKEAIELYERGNRQDLRDKEIHELEIISSYLPRQLSEEELSQVIDEAIQKAGASSIKDVGKVMSILMKELKGKADGKKIQELVRSKLA